MWPTIRDLPGQARRARSVFALVLVPAVGLLVLLAASAAIADVDIGRLTRDPLVVVEAHPLTGFLSNLGVALWSAAAGACFLATLALRRREEGGEAVRFFAWSGALTALLVLDDLFQIHEGIVPRLIGRGETLVIISYVALTALYVWRFRRSLAAAEHVILGAAGAFFALSIGVDLALSFDLASLGERLGGYGHLAEDGAKFIGIAFWLVFYVRTAAAALQPGAGDAAADAATT